MKNDGRAGDDWTTALAKRWQYSFIQLFTAHIRSSTTLANSPGSSTNARPVDSRDRTIASAAVMPGPFRSTMHEWHLAAARGPMGDVSQLSHRLPSDEGKMASTHSSTAVSYAALASNMLSAILKFAASVSPWLCARSQRRMQCVC
jgi:hypothetical protein